ncbi:MAG TPA: AAA family ATPase [Candidatus Limnocylindrales bacterium]|nr:AAA family ATPase [Candidatus Limnocylindrales bacterium]
MKLTIPDPALVLLVGPSGAGKSTFARAHFGPTEIVASDAMRQMLSNDPADQGASAEAFALLSILINGRLRRRLMTVVDATSLRAANRTRYRRLAARYGLPVVAVAFDLPARTFHARNRGRDGRVVEDEVVDWQIEQMARALAAMPSEGYAALHVLRDPDTLGLVELVRQPA